MEFDAPWKAGLYIAGVGQGNVKRRRLGRAFFSGVSGPLTPRLHPRWANNCGADKRQKVSLSPRLRNGAGHIRSRMMFPHPLLCSLGRMGSTTSTPRPPGLCLGLTAGDTEPMLFQKPRPGSLVISLVCIDVQWFFSIEKTMGLQCSAKSLSAPVKSYRRKHFTGRKAR
jgi:hypothetical protein